MGTIFDFQNDADKILLTGNLESVNFEDLAIFAVGQGVGIGTDSDPKGAVATIVGISPEQITQDDFVSSDFISPTFIVEA